MGFLLLGLSLVLISKENHFPGWYALLPTIGALLIILAGETALINRKLLSNPILVFIGLISYPLYLWHWSLLVYARLLAGDSPTFAVRCFVVALSFFLAWFTYKFVETPIRFGKISWIRIASLCAVMAAVGIFGYTAFENSGYVHRDVVKRNVNSNDIVIEDRNQKFSCENDNRILDSVKAACSFYPTAKPSPTTIVVWGDSSGSAWAPVILKLGLDLNVNVIVIAHPSCPPLLGVRKTYFPLPESKQFCGETTLGAHVIESIKNIKPAITFFIGSWNALSPQPKDLPTKTTLTREFITESAGGEADQETTSKALKDQLPHTILELEKVSKVVIFRSWPTLNTTPNYNIKRISLLQKQTHERSTISYSDHVKESKFINEIFDSIPVKNSVFFDPAKSICRDVCDSIVDGRKVYADAYHISAQGSLLLKEELQQFLAILR